MVLLIRCVLKAEQPQFLQECNENNDELALMDSLETGEWQSVNHLNEVKKALMQAATDTALKDTQINIRMARRDVSALKNESA